MDESDRSNDTLKAEGLAAQLYVKSREGAPYVWWHLLREDMKRKFRSAAKKQIADFHAKNDFQTTP